MLALVASAGCSPPAPPQASGALRPTESVQFRAGYFAQDGTAIEIESLPKAIGVHAVPIPGNLSGAPVFPALASAFVQVGERSVLDLARAESKLQKIAAPLNDEARTAGLRISPPEARLTRLGIFTSYADTGKGIAGYASLNGPSNETYSAVYFDRRCSLTGVGCEFEGKTATYDIQIPGPGVYILAMAPISSTTFGVTQVAPPSAITLRIVPGK